MAKSLALVDFVEVDGEDLSEFAKSVNDKSEHNIVDVSGFNSLGVDEKLLGNTTQSVEVEFFWSPEVHDVLYPAHRDKDIVTFKHRPDQNASVSSDNPQLEGNVYVSSYSPGAARGEARAFTVTFETADSSGLAYVAT